MSATTVCPNCSWAESELIEETRQVSAPDGTKLSYDAVYSRCARCGEEYFNRGQSQAANRSASAALRVHLGLLTPEEILEIRSKHQLTQEQLELVLGIGKKTVVRWEAGTVNQSRTADLLLRQLKDGGDLVAQLLATKNLPDTTPHPVPGEWSIEVIQVGGPITVTVDATEGRSATPRKPKKVNWKLRKVRTTGLSGYGRQASLATNQADENGGLLIKVG